MSFVAGGTALAAEGSHRAEQTGTPCVRYLGAAATPGVRLPADVLTRVEAALSAALGLPTEPSDFDAGSCLGARLDIHSYQLTTSECPRLHMQLATRSCEHAGPAADVRLQAGLTLFGTYRPSTTVPLFRRLLQVEVDEPARALVAYEGSTPEAAGAKALDAAAANLARQLLPRLALHAKAAARRAGWERETSAFAVASGPAPVTAAPADTGSPGEPASSTESRVALESGAAPGPAASGAGPAGPVSRRCVLYLGITAVPRVDPGALTAVETASRPILEPERFTRSTTAEPPCPFAYGLVLRPGSIPSRSRAPEGGRSRVRIELEAEAYTPIAQLPAGGRSALELVSVARAEDYLSIAVAGRSAAGRGPETPFTGEGLSTLAAELAPHLAANLDDRVPAYRPRGTVSGLRTARLELVMPADARASVEDLVELERSGALGESEHVGYARVIAVEQGGAVGAMTLTGDPAVGDEAVLLRRTGGLRLAVSGLAGVAPAYPYGRSSSLVGAMLAAEWGRGLYLLTLAIDAVVVGPVGNAESSGSADPQRRGTTASAVGFGVVHLAAGPAAFAFQLGRTRLSIAPRLGLARYVFQLATASAFWGRGADLSLAADIELPPRGALRVGVLGRVYSTPLGTTGDTRSRPELAVLASVGWSSVL